MTSGADGSPAAAIDFYLYSPHEVPTWEPIIRALLRLGHDARFVLEPPGRNLAVGSAPDVTRGWLDDKQGPLVPLVDDPARDRIAAAVPPDLAPLVERRPDAAVVTTQAVGWFRRWRGPRIRTMYGVGMVLDAYGHGPVNEGFDLVLAHGPFSHRAIAEEVPDAPVVESGFPKWARYRRGKHDVDRAAETLGIDRRRPTLAWAPTWAHNSSLGDYDAALASLTARWQVVVKPHANTTRFEERRLAAMPDGVRVVADTTSLVDLLSVADAVVADVRSGALTEAMLADRNVVAVGHAGGGGLHPDLLRCAALCAEPGDLEAAINRAAAPAMVAARREVVPELFGDFGGRDDEVAAEAIAAVVTADRRPLGRRAEVLAQAVRDRFRR